MSAWRIEFAPSARRSLEKLPGVFRARIEAAIATLAEDPYPPSAKHLVGGHDYWRLRVGSYRVVYMVEDDRLIILVLKLGHRRDIYRGL